MKRSALCYNLYSLLVGLSLLLSLTGCPSTPTEERCTGGERRCGDDGNVEECAADGSGFSTSQACTSGQVCAEKDGTLQCVVDPAESCQPNKRLCLQNNVWFCDVTGKPSLEIEVCAAGKTCAIEAGVATCKDEVAPVCTLGDKRCASNGMGVEACRADGTGFDLEAACDAGQACSAASGPATCVAAVCAPGEGRCQGASVERCKMDGSGFEVEQSCAADAQCILSNDEPYCAPTSCTRNVRFCYDDNVWECSSANVPSKVYQACGDGFVCTRDSGVANCAKGEPDPCTPRAERCAADGKSIEVCRTDGVNFKPKTECNGEQTCQEVQGVLACADEVCTPNQTRCAADATGLERCNTNGVGFRRVSTCLPDESCQILDGSSQCASKIDCTPNEPFCQDNNLWSCDAQGKPDKITKSCGTRTCGEVLGKLVCISPEGPCNPGDTRCLPPPITGTALREQCANDGSGFATIPSCPSGQPRCVELAPGNAVCEAFSCNLGAPRCTADGKALERCASNRQSYEIVQTCAANEQCLYQNSFAVCSAQVCPPNEVVCQGNSLYTCRADGSGQTFTRGCGGTSTCVTSATTGQGLCVPLLICTPGETRCNGYINRVDVCNAAGTAFEAQTTCTSPAQCTVENNQASCVSPPLVCAPNTSFCDGDVQRSCSSNGLSSTAVANCGASGLQCAQTSAGARCIPSVTQSCTPGALKCSSAGEQILVCKADGTGFEQQTNCGSAGSCQLQNNQLVCVAPPGSCVPLSTFCDGAVVRSCNVGGTNSSALINCASGNRQCIIVDGAAQCQAPIVQVCTPGEKQCSINGTQISTCRADGTRFDALTSCSGNERCELVNNQPTCQAPPQVCTPSSTFCDGSDVRACTVLGTSSITLQSCAATNRQCVVVNGAAQCQTPPMQVCVAGEVKCSTNSTQVLVCKSDGTGFNVQSSCSGTQSCAVINNQPTCQTPAQVCTPSSTFCDGSDLRACNVSGSSSSLIQSCASTNKQCALVSGVAQCYAPPAQVCTPGQTQCSANGAQILTCRADGSGLDAQSNCTGAQRCALVNNQPTCQTPAQVCSPSSTFCDGSDVRACNASGTSSSLVQGCASTNRQCAIINGSAQCYSPPTQVCTAGQRRCSDTAGQVLVCKADGTGFDVQTSCATNERCELVNNQPTCQAPPQVCSPSSSFCDGSDVRACNASGTSSSLIQGCASTNRQCAEGAQGAYCYSVSNFACAVGERRCASVGERVEVCKADRTGFEAQTTCAANETCQDINGQAACGPDPGIICTANERTCVGTDIVACSSSGRSTFVIQRCANSGGRTCVLENGAPICRSPMVTCLPGYRYNGVSCVDLDECGDGTAVCDALCVNTDGGYDCVSSVADATSPYWSSSCTLSQQLNDPTGLQADCRCNTNKSLTGGLPVCWRPFEAYTRWPNAFGQGPRVGAHPQAHIYGGLFDAAAREIIAVVDWSGSQDPDAGFVMGFNVTTGDRRVISGRWLDPATGAKDKGTGVALAKVQDVKRAADGKLYVMGGDLQGTDIVRVDPATGNRTLVWRRGDAAFGQCDNGRGGGGPVQNTSEGFVMDAQGNFYFGFTNTSLVGEGVGIIRISANGAQCSFVSRSGSLGTNTYAGSPVGAGWTITSGNLRGFSIENNELLALNNFDLTLYAINLTTGDRRRVSSASTSSTLGSGPTAASGIGYRWVSYDPTRQVYWTSGRQGDTQVVLVEPNTGNRHELDCSAIDSTYMGVGCIKGALDTGLSLNFGGFWIDPANANIAYFAHDSMGIVMLEIDSGNSVNLSL